MSTNPTTITAPESTPFVDVVREFDAPVELVFQAHADPELFTKWIGPRGLAIELGEYDCRTGGSYQYTQRDDSGAYGFRGIFHTVVPNELIIQTFEFDGMPNHVSLDMFTLEDIGDGRTRLTSRSVLQSVEDRDGMVSAGMEYGILEGYEKLDELLADLA